MGWGKRMVRSGREQISNCGVDGSFGFAPQVQRRKPTHAALGDAFRISLHLCMSPVYFQRDTLWDAKGDWTCPLASAAQSAITDANHSRLKFEPSANRSAGQMPHPAQFKHRVVFLAKRRRHLGCTRRCDPMCHGMILADLRPRGQRKIVRVKVRAI
jgi:hypothetical protein